MAHHQIRLLLRQLTRQFHYSSLPIATVGRLSTPNFSEEAQISKSKSLGTQVHLLGAPIRMVHHPSSVILPLMQYIRTSKF